MSWIAPEVAPAPLPGNLDERATLEGWLEFHRTTLIRKCQGLGAEQLGERAVPPSTLSLHGLLRHMTEVERGWFRKGVGREDVAYSYSREDAPDADFDETDPARAEADYAALIEEWELARRAAAGRPLDEVFQRPDRPPRSVRWVYTHMIEEYARHNGHADLLRERIDGATGD